MIHRVTVFGVAAALFLSGAFINAAGPPAQSGPSSSAAAPSGAPGGGAGIDSSPAPGIVSGSFEITTFYVPNTTTLNVQAINSRGDLVGYATINGGAQGFERFRDGNIIPIADPAGVPGNDRAFGINAQGIVTGQFYDPVAQQYSGFFDNAGLFTTFSLAGRPAHSTTGVSDVNENGDFCGWGLDFPFNPLIQYGYVSLGGNVTVFQVMNAQFTIPTSITNQGVVTGAYLVDGNSPLRGFRRMPDGTVIAPIDAPGANNQPGQGTVLYAMNQAGDMSGHYWDQQNVEHGFLWTRQGQFYKIDVPGAQETRGGGLNNERTVVGSFVDGNGVAAGYIARFKKK